MLNYVVDPTVLAPHIPPGTVLDLWQGKALVSVVGFMFNDTRVLGVKWPYHTHFEEVNLRYYVKQVGAEEKRGVGFVSEIVPRSIIATMANKLYNLSGKEIEDYSALEQMGLVGFDAACMFSVITHQDPSDAEAIFKMLHRSVNDGGSLYFTAFTSDAVEGYAEAVPGQLNLQSYYHPTVIKDLLVKTGWTLVEIYPEEPLQQTAFVCRK